LAVSSLRKLNPFILIKEYDLKFVAADVRTIHGSYVILHLFSSIAIEKAILAWDLQAMR